MIRRMTEEEKRIKRENEKAYFDLFNTIPMFENNENPRRFSAPKTEGLYLIGNTIFNPITREEFYLVKVGTSTNLKSRMSGYRTQNPLLFHIDFCEKENSPLSEIECHTILCKSCVTTIEKTFEWFRVERETYFEICEKGFEYFIERK